MGVKNEIKVDMKTEVTDTTTEMSSLKRKDLSEFLPLPDHKKQRQEWAAAMRQLLSPPEMNNKDGTINQDYFKPKKVVLQQDKRRWGDTEKEKLVEGLERFGVGGWRDIVSTYLPKWDENTIRIKTCRLIGSQNLKRYMGWKCTKAEAEEAFKKNMELGKRLNCWKAGMLVDNDQGSVALALKEMEGK